MSYDPTPETPPAKTVDNASQASLPGRIDVNYLTWLRCFPYPVLLWIILLVSLACLAIAVTISAIITHRYTALSSLVIFLYLGRVLGRRISKQVLQIKEHFVHGCLNPGQVISVNPYLVAVFTNLTRVPNGEYYAISIVQQPLERTRGKRLQVGDPVSTVALYYGSHRKAHWDTFKPIAVNCVTDDGRVIEDALQRIGADGEDEWGPLNASLPQLPTPYRPGLYPLKPGQSSPTR